MNDIDWGKYREQFQTFKNVNYLNTCSLGLLSDKGKNSLLEYIDTWTEMGASAWYSDWIEKTNSLKQEYANCINADFDEIAILPSVSTAIAVILSCLDLKKDEELITSELDFPTIAHNFKALEQKGKGKAVIVDSEKMEYVDVNKFISKINNKTKLVATSRVFFLSGFINDYEKIMHSAKNNNALFFLDDYQATGQLPIDVKEKNIDIMISGGLKWLLGGSGIVYMYVNKNIQQKLEPSVTGWFSHKRQFEFDPHTIEFSDSATRFETGTPAISSVYPAVEGLKMVNEIGVDNIRERTLYLTQLLVNGLVELGFTIKLPDDLNNHASITMVSCKNPAVVVETLRENNIIVDHRPGSVRISPFFYNTEDDINHCIKVMADIKNKNSELF
ncbi:aminotransferase class V-fold PLP-dependent enzyme [Chloroflexi bacterium]|nr:aminotransferase class V-fold PLP-dependent enzyme [Chloroflexota bacterium]|tara:strand:+ start:5230 stop:6393 length:1164 start_codon:yes stop_codon:yes gene_type:complete